MKIESLELTNFRSYANAVFELHPDVTLVVGPNASGKTNLLESLYVLASTKSFRARDRELIRHGEDYFRLVMRTDDEEYALGVSVAGGGVEKKLTHGGVKKTLVGHVGKIQVTLFEPTDLNLLAGVPEGRRKYLDFVLCQTDREYLKTLQRYRRVLRQRNALLEGGGVRRTRAEVFGWDVALAELAVEIYRQRRELIEKLNKSIPWLYSEIAGSKAALELEYLPSVTGEYESEFMMALEHNLERDMATGFTTIGPHREDFAVRFKDNQIGAVASRGEVRTVVLALKMAELEYSEARTGIRPILLLDDVFSELDSSRRSYLLERLTSHQTIITTTDADAVTRQFHASHKIISTEVSHA